MKKAKFNVNFKISSNFFYIKKMSLEEILKFILNSAFLTFVQLYVLRLAEDIKTVTQRYNFNAKISMAILENLKRLKKILKNSKREEKK